MAQQPVNIHQLQKRVRPVIAAAQRIFTEPVARQYFTFLAATDLPNELGVPISLRIDVKSPTDSRVSDSRIIALTPSLYSEEHRDRILIRERDKLIKAMRYKGNLSTERKAAGMVDFADLEGGSNTAHVPAEILAAGQGGGE